MRSEAIFLPVAVLAIWTQMVVFLTGARRIRAVRSRRVSPGAFRLGESAEVPADVAVVNRHLMNLLEVPVLFYVVTLGFYVTHGVESWTVGVAWAYVALRLAHSFIHLTANRILQRVIVFATSNLVLLALWLGLAWHVF